MSKAQLLTKFVHLNPPEPRLRQPETFMLLSFAAPGSPQGTSRDAFKRNVRRSRV